MGTAATGAVALGAVAGASALIPKVAGVPLNAAGQATGLSPAPKVRAAARGAPVPVPTNWTKSADIVVIGYGGAGAVSAITAFDEGASVLILEKTPSLASLGVQPSTPANLNFTISGGGGNTHMSGGNIGTPLNMIDGANFLYAASWGTTPMDVCQAWAGLAVGNAAWLDSMGIPYTWSKTPTATGGFLNLPGGSSYTSIAPAGSGAGLFFGYDTNVQKRGIPVLFNTPGDGPDPRPRDGGDTRRPGPSQQQ